LNKYNGWFGEIFLASELNLNGDEFWVKVLNKTYEPDTMTFLENNISSNTDFIDIGAAKGAMSLVAASLGARVLAFEPVPADFKEAFHTIVLNSKIASQVDLQNKAISCQSGFLDLGQKTDPNVLSSISHSKPLVGNKFEPIEIISLSEAVEGFHREEMQLIIKIDIEGAEWKLFSRPEILKNLQEHQALVLLAIHPGFNRPFRTKPLGIKFVAKKIWQVKNFIIAYAFFSRLFKVARITRTNLDPIKSPKKCILLMFGGYFEFILDFRQTH
jgi:FkbM family methyltransferase